MGPREKAVSARKRLTPTHKLWATASPAQISTPLANQRGFAGHKTQLGLSFTVSSSEHAADGMDHAEKLRERHRQRVRGRYKLLAADQVKCRALVKELYQQRRTFLALHAQSGESMSNALQRYIDAIALSDRLRKEKHLLLQLMHEREFTQDRVVHIVSECGDFASVRATAVCVCV